jgi:hypothetical protein
MSDADAAHVAAICTKEVASEQERNGKRGTGAVVTNRDIEEL